MDLNPAQAEAVHALSGPLLVLAGAGTGKTRVVTYRIAELIRRRTPPDRILAVTFTNKAADEMQQRSAAILGKRLPRKPEITAVPSTQGFRDSPRRTTPFQHAPDVFVKRYPIRFRLHRGRGR